ncbi:hypothetical protein C8R44DRAFT_699813 [Mycena epipterygia]|nr:hypothetical protein C8R44DRAFT_699813 [Mycena epipterygia]
MFASQSRYVRCGLRIGLCVLLATTILLLQSKNADFLGCHDILGSGATGPPCTSRTEPFDGSSPNIDIMAPTLYPSQTRTWITENQKTLYALMRCTSEPSNCGQNQTKVVIITSFEFIESMQGGRVGGEAIWAYSTRLALNNMGYSVLFASNMERTLQLYHIFHDLVKIVIAHPEQVKQCWANGECVRTSENPSGIPVWKLFSFYFWKEAQNPLGAKWTLNPEDYQLLGYAPNSYLGYSIESQCHKHPFIPHSQRKSQAYILAKWLNYFNSEALAWPMEVFDIARNSTGISFLIGSKNNPHLPHPPPSNLAASIRNVGLMTQDEFYSALSESMVLVGIGDPLLSPTPYDALCLGVPFINPIKSWDRENPSDRTKWSTQHDMLRHLSAPYVYNVFAGDREGFLQAIQDAKANPIQSFVLERMKMSAVEDRFGKILEHDWRAEASDLLKERQALEQGPMFIL